jgi:zinc transporter 2
MDKMQERSSTASIAKNLNIEAAYAHILGDIILSIGVMISATIIYLKTDKAQGWSYYHLADPFCTYLFSMLVVMTTFRVTKKSIIILLDGCLDDRLLEYIEHELKPFKYQNLRVWSVNN